MNAISPTWMMQIPRTHTRVRVTDAEDASRKFLAMQRNVEIGTAYARTLRGAKIFEGKEQIAYVSQNGKVWAGREVDWRPDDHPVFDPSSSEQINAAFAALTDDAVRLLEERAIRMIWAS